MRETALAWYFSIDFLLGRFAEEESLLYRSAALLLELCWVSKIIVICIKNYFSFLNSAFLCIIKGNLVVQKIDLCIFKTLLILMIFFPLKYCVNHRSIKKMRASSVWDKSFERQFIIPSPSYDSDEGALSASQVAVLATATAILTSSNSQLIPQPSIYKRRKSYW